MTSLAQAQADLAAGRWTLARDAFAAIVAQSDDPVALEGLSQAGWWLDDADTCVGARANAYRRYRALGDVRGSARAATALSWDSLLFGSGESVALGWFERARGLLEDTEESPEHGWLAVREAELALAVHHDPDRSFEAARRASAVAQRLGLGELEVVGLAMQGLALTNSGDVGLGMPNLDAAVAAATNGDVADLMWLGKVCCWLIVACNAVQDVARAGEWCRQVEALCTDRDLMPLFNVCRIEHASVQAAQGTWRDAEREFQDALDRLAHSSRSSRTEAIVHLGELRRRQGRFAEAEDLLAQDEFNPTAVVGRAQIRLAAGDAIGASSAIAAALASIPGGNRIARAKLLLPAVRAAHAQGDVERAAVAAAELRATADEVGTDPLLGLAAWAEAILADPVEAAALLREAVRRFHRASLRYDEAETRMALAEALIAAGEETAGREQLAVVEVAFGELSAAGGLEQAKRLRGTLDGEPGPLTIREVEVMRLVSQGMSNRDIATELGVSEHTVHRHVSNILTKLDEPSRSAAVAHAIGAGLI